MIGLYAFILYTTVGDAINLDRAPNLINATSIPAAKFDLNIQNERKASLVYLAAPTHVKPGQPRRPRRPPRARSRRSRPR